MNVYQELGARFGVTRVAAFAVFGKDVAAKARAGKSDERIVREIDREVHPSYRQEPQRD